MVVSESLVGLLGIWDKEPEPNILMHINSGTSSLNMYSSVHRQAGHGSQTTCMVADVDNKRARSKTRL